MSMRSLRSGLDTALGRLALGLFAALQPAVARSADAGAVQQVEIRTDAQAQRRADIAGRQVVGREELLRHGDVRLVDSLQRVPGVSVETRGNSAELKLSGLGGGYTLILLNGEPLPRGATLDNIALDSIERVEIVRGATVQSSQSIAGSINLVTRRVAALVNRDTRLGLASQQGRPQMSAALNLGGGAHRTTWGLGTVLSREQQVWPATFAQERRDTEAATLSQRTITRKREFDNTEAISLNPRLAWKHRGERGDSWQLSTDHNLRYARSSGGVQDLREAAFGPAPAQQTSDMALNYRRLFWRGRAQAQYLDSDGARFEARLSVTHSSRDQQSRAQGFDFRERQVQDMRVDGLAVDQSVVLNLNHQRSLGGSHRLDLGTEWEQARRREYRVQWDLPLPGGLPPEDLDERYSAKVQRWALYLQDDWSLSAGTALQLGLRLERLDTASQGNVFDGVQQTHHLVGPVMRFSTQPSKTLGTFKLGLTRGFRLPTPRDVMPRRYVPIEVSPTTPAQSGNPDLKPERAWRGSRPRQPASSRAAARDLHRHSPCCGAHQAAGLMCQGQRLRLQQRQRRTFDRPYGVRAAIGPQEHVLARVHPHQLRVDPPSGQVDACHMSRAQRDDPSLVSRPRFRRGGSVQQLGRHGVRRPSVQRLRGRTGPFGGLRGL